MPGEGTTWLLVKLPRRRSSSRRVCRSWLSETEAGGRRLAGGDDAEAGWQDAEVLQLGAAILRQVVERGSVDFERGGGVEPEAQAHVAAAEVGGPPAAVGVAGKGCPLAPALHFIAAVAGADRGGEARLVELAQPVETEGAKAGGQGEIDSPGLGLAAAGGGEVEEGEARGVVAQHEEALRGEAAASEGGESVQLRGGAAGEGEGEACREIVAEQLALFAAGHEQEVATPGESVKGGVGAGGECLHESAGGETQQHAATAEAFGRGGRGKRVARWSRRRSLARTRGAGGWDDPRFAGGRGENHGGEEIAFDGGE
jgi:hypothetical protein